MIVDSHCVLGEGPLWHPLEQKLYWIDITLGRLFRYDPRTHLYEQVYQGDVIGGFTIQSDGVLVLFMVEGSIQRWRDGKLTTLVPPLGQSLAEHKGFRFNDAIADPLGRVFTGTLPLKERQSVCTGIYSRLLRKLRRIFISMRAEAREGNLYRLDLDGTLNRLRTGAGRPNGMGFSPDRRQLYVTDSARRNIYVLDFDQETGAIENSRLFTHVPNGEGTPDGLTVDASGHVWSARWDGACVVRYAPDGTEERRIFFPAKKVTSVTFGGANYTDMYVTTAGGNQRDIEGPGAGAVFRLTLGIRGLPEFPSRICTKSQVIEPNAGT